MFEIARRENTSTRALIQKKQGIVTLERNGLWPNCCNLTGIQTETPNGSKFIMQILVLIGS
jgi:hypothetical protein